MAELDEYAWLTGDDAAPWLARMADDGRPGLQKLNSLRRDLSAERARLIVEQVDLRRRAVEKFGDRANSMFFSRVHLEQATDLWIARYKAERLAHGSVGVSDYCCGIGGDLMALAERGDAMGWDLSRTACLLAECNVRGLGNAKVQCDDVGARIPDKSVAWHLDPDRRPAGRRTTEVDAYSPGPDLVEKWRAVNPRGAVKLAPAAESPREWAAAGELEWITRDRECRQQVVWFGPLALAAGTHRATVVGRDGGRATIAGSPDLPCELAEKSGEFLYDPDPSILAARLLGSLAQSNGLSSLGAGGAYLTSDQLVRTPLAAAFAVRDRLPVRTPTLQKYFAERGVGRLEIKKRGVTTDLEALRKSLKLRGDNAATLILTRIGRRETAIVAERLPA